MSGWLGLGAGPSGGREEKESVLVTGPVAPTGFALNGGERVDWVLQESEVELANEYFSALQAHTNYFDNRDVAHFLRFRVCAARDAAG